MNEAIFKIHKNELVITRAFDAKPALVWKAWTEAELLDQWWAPKPWRSVTKSMDFKEGGSRVYSMNGPEGEQHWCVTKYYTITLYTNITGEDAFANSDGKIDDELPVSSFQNSFLEKEIRL